MIVLTLVSIFILGLIVSVLLIRNRSQLPEEGYSIESRTEKRRNFLSIGDGFRFGFGFTFGTLLASIIIFGSVLIIFQSILKSLIGSVLVWIN